MKINKSWHKANPMPKKASDKQRLDWHIHHARECACRPIPEPIRKMMKARKPKVVVSVVVRNNNKYLLVNENLEGGENYWIVPGGKVEFGESLVDAAKREIQEETGIKLGEVNFLCFREAIFPDYNYHTVIFFYEAATDNGKLDKDIENKVQEAGWFSKQEITGMNLVDSAKWLFEEIIK